jgi:hypothetical protein
MAVGITADHVHTRNSLINAAYRTLDNPKPSPDQLVNARETLNDIIREVDPEIEYLWAITTDPTAITLQANIANYTSAEGLPTDIVALHQVYFRKGTGEDTELNILTPRGYGAIYDKSEQGSVVESCYLTDHRDRASRELRIHPMLSSVDTQSEVIGTDTNNYQCIRKHTSDSTKKPITGANWRIYWQLGGSSGSAWADATQYTAPQLLQIKYKRPLFDFDAGTDNPDMPQAWGRYLRFRLAVDLSFEVGGFSTEQRKDIRLEVGIAGEKLGLSNIKVTTDTHNKGHFY